MTEGRERYFGGLSEIWVLRADSCDGLTREQGHVEL